MAKQKMLVDPVVNQFHAALNMQESKVGRFLTTAEVMRVFTRMQPKLRTAILKGISRRPPAKSKPVTKGKPKLKVVK